ncbi:MAG: DJ-1/PfpI family protein [Magnetovibrio sp.]|nr:DJ-1/PfpI family protein [Magnetovibrio sp.]
MRGQKSFDVFLISATGGQVVARADYKVIADYGFDNHPKLDVLIVVGGVHTDELNKPDVIEWVKAQAQQASVVASVCTGAFILAQAQVLAHHTVTTHWQDCADLKQMFPHLNVVEGVRWVDEGDILTSGGISAGIDMSLHMVEKFHSLALAEATAKQMEFSWTKNA